MRSTGHRILPGAFSALLCVLIILMRSFVIDGQRSAIAISGNKVTATILFSSLSQARQTGNVIPFAPELATLSGSSFKLTGSGPTTTPSPSSLSDPLTEVSDLIEQARLYNDTIGAKITQEVRTPLLYAYVKLAYLEFALDCQTTEAVQKALQSLRLQLRGLIELTGKYNEQGEVVPPVSTDESRDYAILIAELGTYMVELQQLTNPNQTA